MANPSRAELFKRPRRFARALLNTAGYAMLLRALPPYTALGIAAAVIFSRNGMRAQDLTAPASASSGFRMALLGSWCALAAPAARALFRDPHARFLRSLPVPRGWFYAVLAACLVALQAPYLALFARGAGALAACGASLSAAGLHALLWSRPRRVAVERLGIATLAAAVVVGHPAMLAAAGALALFIGVPRAFRRADEDLARGSVTATRPAAPPWRTLARTHLRTLWRDDRAALVRGVALMLGGSGIVGLLEHNRAPSSRGDAAALALFTAALPLAAALGGMIAPVVASEARLRWMLASTATPRATAVAASALCATIAGALGGALLGAGGALGAVTDPLGRVGVLASCVTDGTLFGLWTCAIARAAEGPRGIDGERLVVHLLATVAASWLAIAWLGSAMLVPLGACAAAAIARSVRGTPGMAPCF